MVSIIAILLGIIVLIIAENHNSCIDTITELSKNVTKYLVPLS
jgi:hypothetical protein